MVRSPRMPYKALAWWGEKIPAWIRRDPSWTQERIVQFYRWNRKTERDRRAAAALCQWGLCETHGGYRRRRRGRG